MFVCSVFTLKKYRYLYLFFFFSSFFILPFLAKEGRILESDLIEKALIADLADDKLDRDPNPE